MILHSGVTLLIHILKNNNTTLNSLVKYIFNKPNLFPTMYLYNDCKISNIKSLRTMLVFAVIFKYIYTINSLTHNYNTQFVNDFNIALPKLRTAFGQLG